MSVLPCLPAPAADVHRVAWSVVMAWEALNRTQSVGESIVFVQSMGRLRSALETADRCKEVRP